MSSSRDWREAVESVLRRLTRDIFAVAALHAMAGTPGDEGGETAPAAMRRMVKSAYAVADEMMREREKREKRGGGAA